MGVPALLAFGQVIWIALVCLAAIGGALRGYQSARRALVRRWQDARDQLGSPGRVGDFADGAEVTVEGELRSDRETGVSTTWDRAEDERDPEPDSCDRAVLRAGERTEIALGGSMLVLAGSRETEVSRHCHRAEVASGDRVRVRGRLTLAAGDRETGFREPAQRWRLSAIEGEPLPVVSATRPALVGGRRSVARASLLWAAVFVAASTVVSHCAWKELEDSGAAVTGNFYTYEKPVVRPTTIVAAMHPLHRGDVLRMLATDLESHAYGGEAVAETAARVNVMVGDCGAAALVSVQRARFARALSLSECADEPERSRLAGLALHYLGRFREASEAYREAERVEKRPEKLVALLPEAAESHLLARDFGAAAASLQRLAGVARDQTTQSTARLLADAIAARDGDARARARLRAESGEYEYLANILLADVVAGWNRVPLLFSEFRSQPYLGRAELRWLEVMLRLESGLQMPDPTTHWIRGPSVFDLRFLVMAEERADLDLEAPGLARAALAAAEGKSPDWQSRRAATAAAYQLALHAAGLDDLETARAHLDRARALQPTPNRTARTLTVFDAALSYRAGEIRDGWAALDSVEDEDGDLEVFRDALLLDLDRSELSPDGVLSALGAAELSRAVEDRDGTHLPLLLEDEVGRNPSWLYLLAPYIRRGRERILDMAMNARVTHRPSPSAVAANRLRLAQALRSPEHAELWKAIRDRHAEAELSRDTAVPLSILRNAMRMQLERNWAFSPLAERLASR